MRRRFAAVLLGGGCVEICLNEVMSPSPGELLFEASAQSPPSDKTVEMLHFYKSRITGTDFWTAVDLFDRVNMRSKCKVYLNGLQDGDLKVPLCGFGSVKCKCVCFFAWNLELILSNFEDILGDPEAVSQAGRKGTTKVFKHWRKSPWVPTLTRPFPNG